MKDQSTDTKFAILDAAVHHFAKFGYKGASLAKIASQSKSK